MRLPWAFCLSRLIWTVMLVDTVKKRIAIRQFVADTVRRGICLLLGTTVLFVVGSAIGVEAAIVHPLDSSVAAVVNKYCVTCHDSDLMKGGLDLDSLSHTDVN